MLVLDTVQDAQLPFKLEPKTQQLCDALLSECFAGKPQQILWEDDEGVVHNIEQGEGGKQGDPMMPLLFALGQLAALTTIQA